MQLAEFFVGMRNHPILFLGTGFSLRYLKKSYSWIDLLKKISFDLHGNERKFLVNRTGFVGDSLFKLGYLT